jgi:hypothetical protein
MEVGAVEMVKREIGVKLSPLMEDLLSSIS